MQKRLILIAIPALTPGYAFSVDPEDKAFCGLAVDAPIPYYPTANTATTCM
jgi:hypothetical protein